jgi:SAM-dependent methyltransferase
MEVQWQVDEAIHNEGWNRIRTISGEVSAMAKGANLIVDLGGGSGWFGMHLAEKHPGARVISIDFVPRLGESRVMHIKGSALDVPVNSGTADIVGANAILHHVPDHLDKCMSEVSRILKPGGLLLAQEPLAGNPPAKWTRGWVKTSAHEEGERPLPYEAMEKAILGKGFKIENVEFFFLTSYLMPHIVPLTPVGMRGVARKKGLFLVRLDRVLLEKLPGLNKYAAYVSIVARKSE